MLYYLETQRKVIQNRLVERLLSWVFVAIYTYSRMQYDMHICKYELGEGLTWEISMEYMEIYIICKTPLV